MWGLGITLTEVAGAHYQTMAFGGVEKAEASRKHLDYKALVTRCV